MKENNNKVKAKLIITKNSDISQINTLLKTIKNKEEEENKLLNNKLSIIQCRGVIKGVIDILFGFFNDLDFNNDYKIKVDNINQKLNKTLEKDKKNFFSFKWVKFIYSRNIWL